MDPKEPLADRGRGKSSSKRSDNPDTTSFEVDRASSTTHKPSSPVLPELPGLGLFGNLLGTVEKVMLQFTDHLSAQEKRHAAILSKIEDLGKSISEIEKRSDPPTDSIQPPATAFKVLTVQAENISKSVDSCLSHATATQTSIQAIEKSIAYLSDRVGTIEKIQASKSSNQERSSSSSSAQATQTETLMKSLFEKVEAIEHANLLLLKEKDSQFKSLVAQIEESKTQLESKISDTAAPKKAGKKSKSSASSCLSNFSSCVSMFVHAMAFLFGLIAIGSMLSIGDLERLHLILPSVIFDSAPAAVQGNAITREPPAKVFVVFERHSEPEFINWLLQASQKITFEVISRDSIAVLRKNDIVVQVHRVVSSKLEGFWDRELFTDLAGRTGGNTIFASLRSVDSAAPGGKLFPWGTQSGARVGSTEEVKFTLEFRGGMDDVYDNAFNKDNVANLESIFPRLSRAHSE